VGKVWWADIWQHDIDQLPPSEQKAVATWQNKIDRAFPDGAVCVWDRPGLKLIYVTPQINVIRMAGLDPVVTIVPLDRSRVLGPEQVTSYTEVPAGSSRWPPGTVRVTFGIATDAMFWHPKVPDVLLRMRMREGEG
jgi:hypothetical protein